MRPEIPSGWKMEPQSATIEFNKPGEHASEFKVLPDGAKEARYSVRALLNSGGRDYSEGYSLVARPDIGGFFYYQPALQRASVVEVKVPPDLKVGYIMGAGDDIPTVLRQLGLDVTLLTPDDVEHGNLSRFGTIVLGIRAYDTRDDVKKNNQRLLDYVQNGGTLAGAVQHVAERLQRRTLHAVSGATQPRPRDRRRGAGHDSRSARALSCTIPTRLRCTISMAGCRSAACTSWTSGTRNTRRCWPRMIRASSRKRAACWWRKYGKGYYIYTGYAFFRQLPFGVPGAIRLYVNLLSVGHEPK